MLTAHTLGQWVTRGQRPSPGPRRFRYSALGGRRVDSIDETDRVAPRRHKRRAQSGARRPFLATGERGCGGQLASLPKLPSPSSCPAPHHTHWHICYVKSVKRPTCLDLLRRQICLCLSPCYSSVHLHQGSEDPQFSRLTQPPQFLGWLLFPAGPIHMCSHDMHHGDQSFAHKQNAIECVQRTCWLLGPVCVAGY